MQKRQKKADCDTVSEDSDSQSESIDESTHAVTNEERKILLNVMRFVSSHSLYASHGVKWVDIRAPYVLNYTGGVLPRKDHGD